MTDHERELLKWVAEELLGWKPINIPIVAYKWVNRERYPKRLGDLESWHGIGLVVEEMRKRELRMQLLDVGESGYRALFFTKTLGDSADAIEIREQPWFAVYEAARKAVGES